MPRNEPLFPANQIGIATVPTPGRMRQLDQRASEGLNGTDGGSWTPETKLWVGGAGVSLLGAEQVTSGVVETGRKSLGLVLGPSAYPGRTHPSSITRSLRVPIVASNTWIPEKYEAFGFIVGSLSSYLRYVRDPYGLRNEVPEGPVGGQTFVIHLPQLRMHNGARLDRVTLSMRYGRKPQVGRLLVGDGTYMRSFRVSKRGAVGYPPEFAGNSLDMYLIPVFAPSHAYAVGDIIIPTTQNGRQYRVINAGVSGSSSAGWNIVLGGTQTTGSVILRVEARPVMTGVTNQKHHYAALPFASSAAETAAARFNNGLPFEFSFAPNQNATIDTDAYAYGIEVLSLDTSAATFHSVKLDFSILSQSMREP